MPESGDEDFDQQRRNRDKFVREREYNDRPRGRDFTMDRPARDYSNGTGMKRNPIRREDEPVVKRNRFDSASDSFEPQFIRKEETTTAVMLTFKKFLATQDESLTDEEAIEKYKEYKFEFKKQEMEKYFQQHREEEWFRFKYHPVDSEKIKEEQKAFVKKRLDVFTSFFENGQIGQTNLDYSNAANIIRLMDSVVIKLEDGPDEAVEALKDEEIEDDSITDLKKLQEKKSEVSNGSNGDVKKEEAPATDSTIANQDAESSSAKQDNDEIAKPKMFQLHKTSSIFFRNIPTNVKFEELENLCKQHPGFLRIGLTDPLPESKFQRRGWVTFRRDVNVKEIFWGLKNAKIAGADLGAIVNRDLKRRIRFANGITNHRNVVQNDIRQAAKLVVLFDHKAKLYLDEEEPYGPISDLDNAIVQSKNPVLKGIIDYLVEETSAEEEELLGINGGAEGDAKIPLEIDTNMLKVLDKLILYLRIVHSVDFYNHGEYPNEDTMPNRIGMIHVRGFPPKEEQFEKSDNGTIMIPKSFIDNFVAGFNDRLASTLFKNTVLSTEELEKLGYKDAEKAVEDFITANCVELAKDKWLCPLSGKKFKGPEFIRKHLVSKHQEKLDEVKDDALYFNSYLSDPCRPQNPEPKPVPQTQSPATNTSSTTDERRTQDFDRNVQRGNWSNSGRFSGGGRSFQSHFNKPRFYDQAADLGRNRQVSSYRDLDAPEEIF